MGDGTNSGSYLMVDFGISNVKPSDSITREIGVCREDAIFIAA